MIRNIIIEGVDRLGKDTLIDGIQQRLGHMQVVHYQKPSLLDHYVKQSQVALGLPDTANSSNPALRTHALKQYQQQSFSTMFKMLSSLDRLIMNRGHLGEFVYAPRYRGYDGSYVFDMERLFIHDQGSKLHETTLLVLLHTSSFDFIKDDGLSFDFDKKDEEQNDFMRAFEWSEIKHKLMLDIHDGAGGYVDRHQLLETVLTAVADLPQMPMPNWYVSWHKHDGVTVRDNFFSPDPKKTITS